jgi:hypothetical protein
MAEQRMHPRHRVLKAGKIVFNHRFSVVNCTVRNVSDGGACLTVATTLGIPDDFDLVIEPEKETRPCRVAWKSENRLGVTFQ